MTIKVVVCWQKPQNKKEDVAMAKSMSPSEETITAGQAAKFTDLQIARLRKSGLPSEPTQYVLEHEGAEIADAFIADVHRRVEARQRATESHILQRLPFDLKEFLGKDWKIDEQVGERTGDNLDAGKIVTKDYLCERESSINGKDRLKRIKAATGGIQLDAPDFLALWQEKDHVTLKWLYDTRGITWLSFWGTILRDPGGDRSVLYLYRGGDGSWVWSCSWVDGDDWDASYPAGVLASSN